MDGNVSNNTLPKGCVESRDTLKTAKFRIYDNATPCLINISAPVSCLQDNNGLYETNEPILCVNKYVLQIKKIL
jgi:hypothetical protein